MEAKNMNTIIGASIEVIIDIMNKDKVSIISIDELREIQEKAENGSVMVPLLAEAEVRL